MLDLICPSSNDSVAQYYLGPSDYEPYFPKQLDARAVLVPPRGPAGRAGQKGGLRREGSTHTQL